MSIVPDIKILGIAVCGLVLSLLGNGLQGYLYMQQRDARVTADEALLHVASDAAGARAAADSCTASVDALSTAAAVQAGMATQAREFALKLAGKHAAAADKILSTPVAVPGNDCASAQARVADLLQSRDRNGGQ